LYSEPKVETVYLDLIALFAITEDSKNQGQLIELVFNNKYLMAILDPNFELVQFDLDSYSRKKTQRQWFAPLHAMKYQAHPSGV
jgi:hypothetical protein